MEMDIAHACNLHCYGCSHYSNHTLKGVLGFDVGDAWLRAWHRRVRPGQFALLGGEPALNPDLSRYVRLVAELWPEARREVISNGMFLDRHPDLFRALGETGTSLELSIHSRHDAPYLERMEAVLAAVRDKAQAEGVNVNARVAMDHFHVSYRGYGTAMRPFADGDPVRSWHHCRNKGCITLHLNRLWKCPPIAFLGLVLDRYGLGDLPDWQPYLADPGVGLDGADEDILRLYQDREEPICAMCPARPNMIQNLDVTRPFQAGDAPPFRRVRARGG